MCHSSGSESRLLSLPSPPHPGCRPAVCAEGQSGWPRGILVLNDFHIPSSPAKDSAEAPTALSSSACPTSDKLTEDLIEELIEAFYRLPQLNQSASQSQSFPVSLDSVL